MIWSDLDIYARGFLLAPERHDPPASWLGVPVGHGFVLSHDPRVDIAHVTSDGYSVLVLGRAVDLRNPSSPMPDVAESLLRDMTRDRGLFLRNLGFLAGRHVVIDVGPSHAYLTQDASGARSAFVATEPRIVGSHVNLVGDQFDAPLSEWTYEYLTRLGHPYPPGDVTARAGVASMTPNTQLDLTTMSVERFYPSTHLPALAVDDVADIVIGTARPFLRRLHADHRLFVSLTAGRDSRLTLALLRDLSTDVTFFTYHSLTSTVSSHHEDVKFAAEMAADLGLEHVSFDVPKWYQGSGEFAAVGAANNPNGAANGLVEAMRAALPADGLHLKSQHYEIGIGRSESRLGWNGDPLTPEVMEHISSRRNAPRSRRAADEYRSWSSRAGLSAIGLIRDYDLFYWEHRMGTWGSNQLTETDAAIESIPVVNARYLYEAMLGVSLPARRDGAVATAVIRRLWPELLRFPVNGADWPEQR